MELQPRQRALCAAPPQAWEELVDSHLLAASFGLQARPNFPVSPEGDIKTSFLLFREVSDVTTHQLRWLSGHPACDSEHGTGQPTGAPQAERFPVPQVGELRQSTKGVSAVLDFVRGAAWQSSGGRSTFLTPSAQNGHPAGSAHWLLLNPQNPAKELTRKDTGQRVQPSELKPTW